MKKEKRYQECNKIEKLWRRRWYLLVPFKWLFHSIFGTFKIYHDEWEGDDLIHTDKYHVSRGKNLWKLLISIAQHKMKWYYTMEEVKEKLKSHFKK